MILHVSPFGFCDFRDDLSRVPVAEVLVMSMTVGPPSYSWIGYGDTTLAGNYEIKVIGIVPIGDDIFTSLDAPHFEQSYQFSEIGRCDILPFFEERYLRKYAYKLIDFHRGSLGLRLLQYLLQLNDFSVVVKYLGRSYVLLQLIEHLNGHVPEQCLSLLYLKACILSLDALSEVFAILRRLALFAPLE